MATFRQVSNRLKGAGPKAAKIIEKEMRRASLIAESKAKVNATTPRLAVRSGALRASIKGTLTGSGLSAAIRLQAGGPKVPYAASQELGGTIYPRRAKMLAIPLEPRLQGISPRNLGEPNTFILSREGKPFIVQATEAGLVFLYRLVPSVTLKPRYYLRDAFREVAEDLRTRLRTALLPLFTDKGGG